MTKTRRPPTAKALARSVAEWTHPAGTPVYYRPGTRDGEQRDGVTTTNAMVLGGHTAGVYIAGAGFVAISHVEAVDS